MAWGRREERERGEGRRKGGEEWRKGRGEEGRRGEGRKGGAEEGRREEERKGRRGEGQKGEGRNGTPVLPCWCPILPCTKVDLRQATATRLRSH